jgi:hypothetical protein
MTKSRDIRKHFRPDSGKQARAQNVLAAATETEMAKRALDLAISEFERNKLTAEANQKFVRSCVAIRDVFEALTE